MAQTIRFIGEAPDRLNINDLSVAVEAVAPGVELTFIEGVSWAKWPYIDGLEAPDYLEEPEDIEAPYESPDVLTFHNVPDGITKAQVRTFILAHLPDNTTEEEADLNNGNSLVARLLKASDAKLLQLKTKLLSL
jgi:hypothetical protein